MKEMKKIILCPNQARDRGFEFTRKYFGLFASRCAEVYVCPVSDDRYPMEPPPEGMTFYRMEDVMRGADMAVTFGGDGTILEAVRTASPMGVPILGVNLGKKGFIAELERGETDLMMRALDGDYRIEERMMLSCTVKREGEEVFADFALNEIVAHGGSRMLNFTVWSDGERVFSFAGDGVITATPTGSTGYSMSAGGPIVEPSIDNIIVTPVCAHMLVAKSYILSADSEVRVSVDSPGEKTAFISADGGRLFHLKSGDVIEIRRSEYVTRLIRLTNRSFYEKVSEKLGERL